MLKQEIKTFARRVSRRLSPLQKDLFVELMPKLKFPDSPNFSMLKKQFKKINLEIGFGNGDFLLNQANACQDQLFIGCEPFLNGVASLLSKLHKQPLENILLFPDDARTLLDLIPDNYLDNIYIICPDPWPKRKHNKRRLLNIKMFNLLFKKILPDVGSVKIVTDHKGYATWILEKLHSMKYFGEPLKKLEDFRVDTTQNWFLTKYQNRGLLSGHDIYYFEL